MSELQQPMSPHIACTEHKAICERLEDLMRESSKRWNNMEAKVSTKLMFSVMSISWAIMIAIFGWMIDTNKETTRQLTKNYETTSQELTQIRNSLTDLKMTVKELQIYMAQQSNEQKPMPWVMQRGGAAK